MPLAMSIITHSSPATNALSNVDHNPFLQEFGILLFGDFLLFAKIIELVFDARAELPSLERWTRAAIPQLFARRQTSHFARDPYPDAPGIHDNDSACCACAAV